MMIVSCGALEKKSSIWGYHAEVLQLKDGGFFGEKNILKTLKLFQ